MDCGLKRLELLWCQMRLQSMPPMAPRPTATAANKPPRKMNRLVCMVAPPWKLPRSPKGLDINLPRQVNGRQSPPDRFRRRSGGPNGHPTVSGAILIVRVESPERGAESASISGQGKGGTDIGRSRGV